MCCLAFVCAYTSRPAYLPSAVTMFPSLSPIYWLSLGPSAICLVGNWSGFEVVECVCLGCLSNQERKRKNQLPAAAGSATLATDTLSCNCLCYCVPVLAAVTLRRPVVQIAQAAKLVEACSGDPAFDDTILKEFRGKEVKPVFMAERVDPAVETRLAAKCTEFGVQRFRRDGRGISPSAVRGAASHRCTLGRVVVRRWLG